MLPSKRYHAAPRDPTRCVPSLSDKLSASYVRQSAWELVRQNEGAAGIDPQPLAALEAEGVPELLAGIAPSRPDKPDRPQPVRRVAIPQRGDPTRPRPLGIPTGRDRVGQAAAKLLLDPIFAADFEGCAFGFRPEKGPRDALEAVHHHSRQGYRWVVDADIQQCFDLLDHPTRMTALRGRIRDGEVLQPGALWAQTAGCRRALSGRGRSPTPTRAVHKAASYLPCGLTFTGTVSIRRRRSRRASSAAGRGPRLTS